MKSSRALGAISLPLVILLIFSTALLLSLLFFSFWQRLSHKVETILRDQFNQQQLMLARKIADNVEAYFDYLENELLAFPYRFQSINPKDPAFEAYMAARFKDMRPLGILAIRRYNRDGLLVQAWGQPATPAVSLPPLFRKWAQDPNNRHHLLLGKTDRGTEPPWQGCLVMPFLTQLYPSLDASQPSGALELLIDPFFICGRATAGVRSGETGYAWIIDQKEIILAHYDREFIGQEAMPARLARNPKIVFRGLKEIHALLLSGHEGMGEYESGWHRQRLGPTPKLVGYTTIRFDRGLVRNVTEVVDPAHNLWGVAVVAPVAEVSGNVRAVLHQALFLVGLFFLVVLLAGGGLIGAALVWNRSLSREVELKTKELVESQKLLLRSERFAAIGEAASYVSHEIKNPLMVIGGLARQVERHLEADPASQEKLQIIQTEVRRLENFLGDLRDFTRPALPVKERVDLNQVIKEVETLMQEEIRHKGVSLIDRLAPQLPLVEADPNQIKQVLLNLLKNSLEAMDSGGEIALASGVDAKQVWFAVKDTGGGMPPEVLEKIFNPFFTTKEKGTGLGLAVIHKIITDHQGTISVESSPEKGTSFLVKLPASG
ncbi:MAG: ATP-binding protein [Thermodesulfobacteriota bacterium]